MPEIVKFETVIPDGWERCEWECSEAIAWGKKFYEYAQTIYSVSGLALMSNGEHEASFELCADRGIIPIRRRKPIEFTIETTQWVDGQSYETLRVQDVDTIPIEWIGKTFREVVE